MLPQLRPGLVSTHVLAMVSAERSLNFTLRLTYHSTAIILVLHIFSLLQMPIGMETYHFQANPAATFGPNPHSRSPTISVIRRCTCMLEKPCTRFEYHTDGSPTYRFGVIRGQNLTPDSHAVQPPRGGGSPTRESPPLPSPGSLPSPGEEYYGL